MQKNCECFNWPDKKNIKSSIFNKTNPVTADKLIFLYVFSGYGISRLSPSAESRACP